MTMEERFETGAALVFLIAGIACLCFPAISAEGVFLFAAGLSTLSALLLLYEGFRYRRLMDLLKAAAILILAVLFWSVRAIGVEIVCLIFALYLFGTSLILLVEGLMDLKEKSRSGWSFIALAIVYALLGGGALYLYHHDPTLAGRFAGVYLMVQALQMMVELFVFRHHKGSRSWSFRYWSSLPVYLVAIAPSLILRVFERRPKNAALFDSRTPKNDETVNLRVFVHSGLHGDQQFGHMTFAYKGIMFSYGNYDKSSEKLFRTFGPGILFTVPADIYVNNCCVYEKSELFEYGLHLSEAQEEKLVSLLHQIFASAYRWYCPLFEQMPDPARFEKFEDDYSCRLAWRTGAKFYKFHTGVWKTYWVFGRNCSLFASELLHQIDDQIHIPRGINTPGEYFEYFSEAYQDPDSNVITQSWHSAAHPETLYPTAL